MATFCKNRCGTGLFLASTMVLLGLIAASSWREKHDNVEQISCRHFKWKSMQVSVTDSRSRLCDCRFKQADITNGRVAAVPCRLVDVNGKHIVEFKKFNVLHLLCQLSQIGFKGPVDFAQACFEFLLPRLVPARRNHQLIAISTDFQWRFGRDLKHFQNRFVNHQRQTIAVFYEHFLHVYRLSNRYTQSVYNGSKPGKLELIRIAPDPTHRTNNRFGRFNQNAISSNQQENAHPLATLGQFRRECWMFSRES